ncbi:BON domain-containing protein [Curtobacterium flaccumfaciens pv. oortii]|uniref:BON domain-containing protein n=1 Tax=Curtobacterium flaccumfaciens TaxID=2035 RepID=UPI00265B1EC7|nr:BON domain-containing protein [Curtobacterium flaccumfaciens]MCS5524719.1 BON domain-containing protein [Curtobacterium flaccumfaciens pv. oortii]
MDTSTRQHDAASTVRDRLLQAWSAERSLDASTLDAAVGNGRVVLTGDVGCHSDRATAVGLAEQNAPTLAVENRIVVRGYDCDPEETDAMVHARVSTAINTTAPHADLDVRVEDHVVTIAGAVNSDGDRRAVHAATARCAGVHFVVDRISTV